MISRSDMAEASDLCLAILAAGSSRRFGADDKLVAPLKGEMLGLHMSDRLAGGNFRHKFVISSAKDHACATGWKQAGFEIAVNADASDGMGTSLALAAKLASDHSAKGLLICLADMPLVPLEHIHEMLSCFESAGKKGRIASSGAGHISPPAIFGKDDFPELMQLNGDIGARHLLAEAEMIDLPAHQLADIDDPEALQRLNAL